MADRKLTLITENLYPYHLVNRLRSRINAQESANRIAFSQWDCGQQSSLTWSEVGERTSAISRRLLALQVATQGNIGLFAHNSMDWSLVDFAALQIRAVTVPLYATSSVEQAAYIVNDANINILFVGEDVQYQVACQLPALCPQLKMIVVMNESVELIGSSVETMHLSAFMSQAKPEFQTELDARIAAHNLSDLFTIIYTSGTTGEPKGVMLDYYNMAAQLYLHDQRLKLTADDISLSFLPLSHVFERAWSFYVMHVGALNVYLTDTNNVREALADVKPTVMCAVPRFYEKVYSAVQSKAAKQPWLRRGLFNWAISLGKSRVNAIAKGRHLHCLTGVFSLSQIN